MKKLSIIAIAVCVLLATVTVVSALPWVYPYGTSTFTGSYVVPLTSGSQEINLVLWNHDNTYALQDAEFVIAIPSGLAQVSNLVVTINGVVTASDAQDLTGTTTPDGFPSGTFTPTTTYKFPCPWIEYPAGDLAKRTSSTGWTDSYSDTSGRNVTVTFDVSGNPSTVFMAFVAYGTNTNSAGNVVNSPYTEITTTITPPNNVVPEVPFGPIAAGTSMLAAFGLYYGIRKRKIHL